LEKAVVLALPLALLLGFSIVRLARARTLSAWLQLLGAGCLLVVVLTHVAEALHIVPSMGWGEPHSLGHYADFASALLGITLLLAAFGTAPGAKWWAAPDGRTSSRAFSFAPYTFSRGVLPRSSENPALRRDHWALGRPSTRSVSMLSVCGQPAGESSQVSCLP
jgi:protein-S-isoprenylcysteine O-methyltransferase Ste14